MKKWCSACRGPVTEAFKKQAGYARRHKVITEFALIETIFAMNMMLTELGRPGEKTSTPSLPQLNADIVSTHYKKYALSLCETLLSENGYQLEDRIAPRLAPLSGAIGPRQAMGRILNHTPHKHILPAFEKKGFGERVESARDLAKLFDQEIVKYIKQNYPSLDRGRHLR